MPHEVSQSQVAANRNHMVSSRSWISTWLNFKVEPAKLSTLKPIRFYIFIQNSAGAKRGGKKGTFFRVDSKQVKISIKHLISTDDIPTEELWVYFKPNFLLSQYFNYFDECWLGLQVAEPYFSHAPTYIPPLSGFQDPFPLVEPFIGFLLW